MNRYEGNGDRLGGFFWVVMINYEHCYGSVLCGMLTPYVYIYSMHAFASVTWVQDYGVSRRETRGHYSS